VLGNIRYGWMGTVDGFDSKTLVDASNGFVDILGYHKSIPNTGESDGSDDVAVLMGITLAGR
jgi:hypothetical protein